MNASITKQLEIGDHVVILYEFGEAAVCLPGRIVWLPFSNPRAALDYIRGSIFGQPSPTEWKRELGQWLVDKARAQALAAAADPDCPVHPHTFARKNLRKQGVPTQYIDKIMEGV